MLPKDNVQTFRAHLYVILVVVPPLARPRGRQKIGLSPSIGIAKRGIRISPGEETIGARRGEDGAGDEKLGGRNGDIRADTEGQHVHDIDEGNNIEQDARPVRPLKHEISAEPGEE